jgi:spermidine/putrescine transport system permease protein
VFTLDNYRRALEPMFIGNIYFSIYLALISTLICFALGYPVAYIMSRKEYEDKSLLLFLFLLPMWMNFLVRTYAWVTILEINGVLNTFLTFFGLQTIQILYTEKAVVLGMVYNFLPFMILPIYTVLKKIDNSYIEAAQDLGADKIEIFTKIIFPLSLPGVIAGVTMVFLPSLTTFIISEILGGGMILTIGNVIERQFLFVGDWHFGSALSMILILIIVLFTWGMSLISQKVRGGKSI